MAESPLRVGFVTGGPLSDEQAAALAWLEERDGLEAVVVGTDDVPAGVDVAWWHCDEPLDGGPPGSATSALSSLLGAGRGVLLTLRAMGAVTALGYESVLPARGEVLAGMCRGGSDVPHEMSVAAWDAESGAVLGVGTPVLFGEAAVPGVAANRDQLIRGCLRALAGDGRQPSRPKTAAELRAVRERAVGDRRRPVYHFTPPANWLNDPNGLLRWNGRYHLFYQYNPAGPFHNTIHWGHAVSDDLVEWQDEPVTLAPSPDGPDRDGCWSGCAVDDDGTATALYTGGNGRRQLPCLATAEDPALRHWQKHQDNPVIDAPPPEVDVVETDHWEAEFRDHSVWREDDTWYQLVGTGVDGAGGAALLYSSGDLRDWRYEGPLLVGSEDGTVWECPELLDLGEKQLLHVSNYENVVYFLGEVDSGEFHVDHQGLLDHGDFYAPQSLRDGDRSLTWGWLPEACDLDAQWDAGWSGALSLPRVLSLGPDSRLRQRPAEEMTALRERRVAGPESLVLDSERRGLDASDRALEVQLEVALGDATAFELSVFESPGGEELTPIRYTSEGDLLVERSSSSQDPRATTDAQGMTVTPYDESLSLRGFLDGSVVELYANRRHCLTSRVYPTRPDSTGLSVRAEGGRARVESLSVWRLRPAVTVGAADTVSAESQ